MSVQLWGGGGGGGCGGCGDSASGEAVLDQLSQLLGQVDVGRGNGGGGGGGMEEEEEEEEEGLLRAMEGMMGTLLSRDVLYPSLTEICRQVSPPPHLTLHTPHTPHLHTSHSHTPHLPLPTPLSPHTSTPPHVLPW